MPASDYLLDAAEEHRPHIRTLYRQLADKKPILLLDLQEQRIYAYPYADFSKELSEAVRARWRQADLPGAAVQEQTSPNKK